MITKAPFFFPRIEMERNVDIYLIELSDEDRFFIALIVLHPFEKYRERDFG